MDARRKLGQAGEAMAARLLSASGLTIVETNWRCREGELDIVAHEEAPDLFQGSKLTTWLVVVEVRTRRGMRFGTAKESVTASKQAKLRKLAEAYVQSVRWLGPWRIDVVAIQLDAEGRMIGQEHLRHAVTA